MNAVIARLDDDGVPIKEIVRRTGHSRKLVRQVIRGECVWSASGRPAAGAPRAHPTGSFGRCRRPGPSRI